MIDEQQKQEQQLAGVTVVAATLFASSVFGTITAMVPQ